MVIARKTPSKAFDKEIHLERSVVIETTVFFQQTIHVTFIG